MLAVAWLAGTAFFALRSGDERAAPAAVSAPPGAPNVLRTRLFYAHLYIGLYHEAHGSGAGAREHILLAAEKYAGDDYMGDVARVHAEVLRASGLPEGQSETRRAVHAR